MKLFCLATERAFEAVDTGKNLVAYDCPICDGVHKYQSGRPTLAPMILPDEPSDAEVAEVSEVLFDKSLSFEEQAERLDEIREKYPRRRGHGEREPCPEVGVEHAFMTVYDPETGEPDREACLGCPVTREVQEA